MFTSILLTSIFRIFMSVLPSWIYVLGHSISFRRTRSDPFSCPVKYHLQLTSVVLIWLSGKKVILYPFLSICSLFFIIRQPPHSSRFSYMEWRELGIKMWVYEEYIQKLFWNIQDDPKKEHINIFCHGRFLRNLKI